MHTDANDKNNNNNKVFSKEKFRFSGSDALISEQPYRYLTADLMKSLRDDSLPIDVTRDDPVHRQGKKYKNSQRPAI